MQTDLFRTVLVLEGEKQVRIEFDGGTSCNIPAQGYGLGYGSFRIDQNPIRKVQFYKPMSNNAAEIGTLAVAVDEAVHKHGAKKLLIIGDSMIALGWAQKTAGQKPWPKELGGTPEFREAIMDLATAMKGVGIIETKWQPRLKSVETFGH